MTTADDPEEMVNPPVRESDSNSQDEEKNDDSSVISSRSYTEDFSPDRCADLTSPDACRVKHRRQVDNKWINMVCGALTSVCHYKNHPALRDEVGGRFKGFCWASRVCRMELMFLR